MTKLGQDFKSSRLPGVLFFNVNGSGMGSFEPLSGICRAIEKQWCHLVRRIHSAVVANLLKMLDDIPVKQPGIQMNALLLQQKKFLLCFLQEGDDGYC